MVEEQYYEKLTRDFLKLLESCKEIISDSDLEEVMGKIDNKEYGIALQSLSYSLLESSSKVQEEDKKIIFSLFERMGMMDEDDDDYWLWEKMKDY